METALTIRDRKILELFASGLSPQEVEEKMGVPAAHALVRCKEILASRDVFDEIKRALCEGASVYGSRVGERLSKAC